MPSNDPQPESAAAPGWYPDPMDSAILRWWDGAEWSDRIKPVDGEAEPSPTDVPSGNRKRSLRTAAIAGALALVAGGAALAFSGPGEVAVDFAIDVDKRCTDTSYGYSDIDGGTEVEVVSGSGEFLGLGLLDYGDSLGYSRCTYSAEFTVDESPDGIYRVSAGNSNRGTLTYFEDDLEDGVLRVRANLG